MKILERLEIQRNSTLLEDHQDAIYTPRERRPLPSDDLIPAWMPPPKQEAITPYHHRPFAHTVARLFSNPEISSTSPQITQNITLDELSDAIDFDCVDQISEHLWKDRTFVLDLLRNTQTPPKQDVLAKILNTFSEDLEIWLESLRIKKFHASLTEKPTGNLLSSSKNLRTLLHATIEIPTDWLEITEIKNVLRTLSKESQEDQTFIRDLLKKVGAEEIFPYVPEWVCDDPDMLLLANFDSSYASSPLWPQLYKLASIRLKEDPTYLNLLAHHPKMPFWNISDKFTSEQLRILFNSDPARFYPYLDDTDKRNPKYIEAVLKKDASLISNIPTEVLTEAYLLEAFHKPTTNDDYIRLPLRKIPPELLSDKVLHAAVACKPSNLEDVPSARRTKALALTAFHHNHRLRNDLLTSRHIDMRWLDDPTFVHDLLTGESHADDVLNALNPKQTQVLLKKYPKTFLDDTSPIPSKIPDVFWKDTTWRTAFLEKHPDYLDQVPSQYKPITSSSLKHYVRYIKKDPSAYDGVPASLKEDLTLIQALLSSNELPENWLGTPVYRAVATWSVSFQLSHLDLLKQAYALDPSCVRHFAPPLWKNKTFLLTLCRIDPYVLDEALKKQSLDQNTLLEMIEATDSIACNFKELPKSILTQEPLVRAIAKKNWSILMYAPNRMAERLFSEQMLLLKKQNISFPVSTTTLRTFLNELKSTFGIERPGSFHRLTDLAVILHDRNESSSKKPILHVIRSRIDDNLAFEARSPFQSYVDSGQFRILYHELKDETNPQAELETLLAQQDTLHTLHLMGHGDEISLKLGGDVYRIGPNTLDTTDFTPEKALSSIIQKKVTHQIILDSCSNGSTPENKPRSDQSHANLAETIWRAVKKPGLRLIAFPNDNNVRKYTVQVSGNIDLTFVHLAQPIIFEQGDSQ